METSWSDCWKENNLLKTVNWSVIHSFVQNMYIATIQELNEHTFHDVQMFGRLCDWIALCLS